jgi:hypothetical protein
VLVTERSQSASACGRRSTVSRNVTVEAKAIIAPTTPDMIAER